MLQIKYCIRHEHPVHALISIRDTAPFHMTREGHETIICYGPFAETEPPTEETNWPGIFASEEAANTIEEN